MSSQRRFLPRGALLGVLLLAAIGTRELELNTRGGTSCNRRSLMYEDTHLSAPEDNVKEDSCNMPPRLRVPVNLKAELDSLSAKAARS